MNTDTPNQTDEDVAKVVMSNCIMERDALAARLKQVEIMIASLNIFIESKSAKTNSEHRPGQEGNIIMLSSKKDLN